MDIYNLETFIEVAETRSFSRSAKILSLTQPAVSKRIAALESELSTRLFDRVGRTVHLTEAGRILLPSAKQIRSELLRMQDAICNIGKNVHGKLAIGTTEYVATHQLPSFLKSYRQLFPDVSIDLRFDSTEELLESVESAFLELALCPLHRISYSKLSPRLRCSAIWSYNLKVVVANHHPLATCTDVQLEQLVEAAAILPSPKTLARKVFDELLLAHGLQAGVSLQANNFNTMRSMSSIGLGWTCLPESEIDETLTVLAVKELELPHTIALIRRQDLTLSRAAEEFLSSLSVTLNP